MEFARIIQLNMEHFYHDIVGWFTFPKLYSKMVERFPSGSKFLEIGTYAGKSFAYLVVEAINSGKEIEITGLDGFGWEGLKEDFDRNMKPVEGKYFVIKGNSIECSKQFPDKYFDFVFIDANHTYEDVKADILAYLPKIKDGGVIAGHDYCDDWKGVIQAVNEVFEGKANIEQDEVSWWIEVK